MQKAIEMDMTRGKLSKQILICAVPLILISVAQMLFHSSDVFILGLLVSDQVVGAVGTCSPLINLLTSLFLGLSVGTNILVSKYLGSNEHEKVRKVVGMSVLVSIICGLILIIITVPFAEQFLIWLECPIDKLKDATRYLQIYLLGSPVILLYQFCSAIMRSMGDNTRPLIYLLIGGAINIVLNVFFIAVCGLSAEGVALATIISELFSAVLILRLLRKNQGVCRLEWKYLKIYFAELKQMLYIGIPSGVQNSLFGIANVIIQKTINSFSGNVLDGNTLASQLDGIVFYVGNAIGITVSTFIAANYGAKNFKRIKQSFIQGSIISVVFTFIAGVLIIALGRPICSLISQNPEIIDVAARRIFIMCIFYWLDALMNVFGYGLRSLGKSTLSMMISLIFVCFFRLVWIYTLLTPYPDKSIYFGFLPRLETLYLAWPITWILCSAVFIAITVPLLKKIKIKFEQEKVEK